MTGDRLAHLFVEPEHQGEALIADGGHSDFELQVRIENHAAIAFYERAGWTDTGRRVHTIEHGIGYDERVLTKRQP